MRISESAIRRIIKEEAKRVMREGAFPEEVEAVYGKPPPEDREEHERFAHETHESSSSHSMDPTGLLERYMTEIEDLFVGGYDHDDAMYEAEGMIDDLCEELKDSMHMWLRSYLAEEQIARGEYESDMEEDR